MKTKIMRWTSLLLVLTVVAGLLGCTVEPAQTTEPTAAATETAASTEPTAPVGVFSAGYGRVDITPEWSVPLSGYGNLADRMSKSVKHRIYATCVALTDTAGQTILLMSLDLQETFGLEESIPLIAERTGVPETNIYLVATHTHSAPGKLSGSEASYRYFDMMPEKLIQAGQAALADRKEAELFRGSVETDGLNFIRHYKSINADGTENFFGDNFGKHVYDTTTTHTTQIDQTMHLLKITRQGEKDIVVANWRAHPHLESGADDYVVSADYVGGFRTAIEAMYDCQVMFMQGAAGNNNAFSNIISERRASETHHFGKLLAEYAIEGLTGEMIPVEINTFKIKSYDWEIEVDHGQDSLLAGAMMVSNIYATTKSDEEVNKLCERFGISSIHHAYSIITVAGMAATQKNNVNAVILADDLGFVTSPTELFDTLGEMIEDGSPCDTTMVFCYTNGYTSYIPSAYAFEYGGYEVDVCRYAAGIGEKYVDTLVGMLNELYAG